MAWPVADFDQVSFKDGLGAAEVAAIHLAIKERADLTGHSLAAGDYAAPYSGVVWIQEPDAGDGRVYLRDWLQAVYLDLDALVAGDANIRWTLTPGAGTTWTLPSLVTDIGMGSFDALLTGVRNPDALIWLHEALDRLIYPQVLVPANGGTYRVRNSSGYSTRQLAWDHRGDSDTTTAVVGIPLLKWDVRRISPNYEAYIFNEFRDVTFPTAGFAGTLDEAYYKYTWLWANTVGGLSIDATVGTESFTATGSVSASYQATTDAVIGADTVVDMDFVTTEPATVPFFSVTTQSAFLELGIGGIRIHLSIASELTDQA